MSELSDLCDNIITAIVELRLTQRGHPNAEKSRVAADGLQEVFDVLYLLDKRMQQKGRDDDSALR